MINKARKDEKNIAKEPIIEQTYCSENLPCPLFTKEGEFLPFVKGGKEGFSFLCPYNYGLTNVLKKERRSKSC
jgi:hypothetical protein